MATNNDAGINIYARLRKIMPWEDDELSATAIDDYRILNRSKREQAYKFTQVFKPNDDNEKLMNNIGMPLLNKVLRGYNSILMAYGQTGSGKTYSILGKINHKNANNHSHKGLLALSLLHLIKQPNVSYLELSAIETFGHHIQKIRLFDLANEENQIEEWDKKHPMKASDKIKNAKKIRLNEHNIQQTIKLLHNSSHFAPTAKNPESSRGHICYVTTVHLKHYLDDENDDASSNEAMRASTDLVSHWVVVDLAGSEGESALTADFQRTAQASEVMARRLEAWCINHGLSQLQVIFNELKGKKKKGAAVGTGLKKSLSEFISYPLEESLAVLFTISPSSDNAKSTEATLRFAESAALIESIPVKAKKKINKDLLISELRKDIQALEGIIATKDEKIQNLEQQLLSQKEDVEISQSYNDQSENELAKEIENKLKNLQNLENEAKEDEDIWHATKAQILSLTDEEDLEQSMKDQMSDIRRASRVSADVDIITSILSQRASITSLRSFKCDNRINTILESALAEQADDEFSADSDNSMEREKVDEIIEMYEQQKNVMNEEVMTGLNKKELMHLCAYFAENQRNSKGKNVRFRTSDETDAIIQNHEEQIKFLTVELNRLSKYHRLSISETGSIQSDVYKLNRMNMDDLDDIDEKFDDENAGGSQHHPTLRDPSPSSTRIDPMNAYNYHHDSKKMYQAVSTSNQKDSVLDIEDDEKVNEEEKRRGCQCCIL